MRKLLLLAVISLLIFSGLTQCQTSKKVRRNNKDTKEIIHQSSDQEKLDSIKLEKQKIKQK
jgi:Tfp pilus assembly protein PilN